MANFSLRQFKNSGQTDPATATFDQAPVAGNLIIAIAMERSGLEFATSYNISPGGETWVQRIARSANYQDHTFRRTLSVWAKVANGSEPLTVTVDDGTTNAKALMIAEYQADTLGTWTFEDAVSNDSDAVQVDRLSLGPTASVPNKDLLLIGALGFKAVSGYPGTTISSTWDTDTLTQDAELIPSSNDRGIALASATHLSGGSKTTSVNIPNPTNSLGLIAGLLVFSFSPTGAVFRGHSVNPYGNRTNTVLVPPVVANNDIMTLAFISLVQNINPPTITAWPPGFSIKSGFPTRSGPDGSGNYVHFWLLEKIALNESGNYTVTHSTLTTQAVIITVQNGNASNVTSNTGTGTTSTALGLNAGANSLIAFLSHCWEFSVADPPTGNTPTFTERVDGGSSLLYLATGSYVAGGPTGNKSHTNNNIVENPWAAHLIHWPAANQVVIPVLSNPTVFNLGPNYLTPRVSITF